MTLKPRKNTSYNIVKPAPLHQLSEDELAKRLYFTIVAIVIFIILAAITLIFFAPKIGGLFEFLTNSDSNEISEQITPTAPVLIDVPPTTKNETISLEGYADPGTTVKLFMNGPEVQSAVADIEGHFTFDNISLIKGKNILFAKTVNQNNQESESSGTFTINYDNKAPEIKIDSPKNDETVRNLDERILVKITVDEKAEVRVNGRTAIQKQDNSYEILLGVKEGKVEIKVEAEDEAGNASEESITITYDKSS